MKKLRCLIIGLDGATFDLIGPWIEDGSLRTLKRLMEEGAYGVLRTEFPPITACAWSSFLTGKNPGKHGIYDFLYREEGKYTSRPNNRLTRRAFDFWQIFNQYGFSTGLINVPMTYPPGEIKGYMITGIMTPRSHNLDRVNYTYPETLKFEIEEKVGKYSIHPRVAYRKGKAKELYEDLLRDLKVKSKTIQYLLDKYPTDLNMFVIGGTDRIIHELYHFIDPNHPYYNRREARKNEHFIKDYFIKVDEELGLIINKFCSKDTLIIVMSDHGMGPLYKWIHLNVWLLKEGYLKLKKSFLTRIRKMLFDIGFTPSNIYRVLLYLGFSKSNISFEQRDKLISYFFLSWDDIDWKRTQAYSRGHVGQIFINKRGREPQGIVGEEKFCSLKREIEEKLLQLQDKNKCMVEKILDPDQIYKGPYRDLSADIIFMPWKLEYFALGTSAFVSNKPVELCFGSTGNHRMEGIFIIKGEGIKKNFKIQEARIVDVVVNLLFYYNLPIDKDMDGVVLEDIYESEFLQSKKPIYQSFNFRSSEGELSNSKYDYSDEEVNSVKKALKDLGYFG